MANRLRIPDEVLARMGERGVRAVTARSGPHVVEVRAWSGVEMRESSSAGGLRVVGYASTYDQPYPIWGGPANGGFDEIIVGPTDRSVGAFAKSVRERDDVRFLLNHDGVPLARTKSGTMTLEADDVGLLVDADLDPGSPIVAGLRSAMERGDMDQMSFAFEVTQQRWSPDFTQRFITEVRLYDVSVVTYPANDQTMALVGADTDRPKPQGRSLALIEAEWRGLAG